MNVKKYSLERAKFIKGLVYFEKILKCNVILSCEIIDTINLTQKLSTNDILSYIYNSNKEYFNDDKIMIALFDDIALINGYTFKSLPQRKTIIRQYFKILEKIEQGIKIESPEFKYFQINLFDK